MKKVLTNAVLASLLSFSCTTYQVEDDSTESSNSSSSNGELTVEVRSSNSTSISYPLNIFVFDESGECVYTDELDSSEESFLTELSQGTYYVVALTGLNDEDYSLPSEYTYDDFILLSNNNAASEALLAARSEVDLEESTTLTLTLKHTMTAISATLYDVPEEAIEVSLKISPLSSAMSFAGEYKNDSKSSTIDCQLEDDEWTASTVYLFPCESTTTKLSITVTTDESSATFSCSIQEQLEAGQPYHLVGSYTESELSLEGTFEIEAWKESEEIEFTFGSGVDTSDDTDDEDEVETVSEVPEDGDIWNDCLVWNVEELSTGEIQFYIISPEEITDYYYNAVYYLALYEYGDWTDWTVFTKDEAVEFRTFVNNYGFDELNELIEEAGGTTFAEASGKRYLCEDCTYSFSLHTNTISAVGTKTKYILRPIKLITVSVE